MKNKIKIYLQYPWKFPDSPYYKYLVENPPEGIKYLNTKKQKGVITSKRFFWFSNFLKRNIRLWANNLNLSIPNAHKSPKGNYDLIHCAHCLSKSKDKPWVADFEAFWQLWISTKKTKKGIKKIDKILKRKNCVKILLWTEKVEREFLEAFPKLKNKIELVRPAVPLSINNKKFRKKINLLFVGRYFYWKGGLHALEAMDRLTKEYPNVEAVLISEVPKEIKERYAKNKKIKIYGLMPQEKVFEFYKKSDIFIYPGYSDSFGFAFLEAMSFGIPIVTVDGYARREIVEDGKTGFVIGKPNDLDKKMIESIEEKLIKKLIKNSEKLIKDKKLLERMSKNCLNEIKQGKFSIQERNKKLKRIYEEALK